MVENKPRSIGTRAVYLTARLGPSDQPHDLQKRQETVAVCVSAVEKVYLECEWIISRLASEFDGFPGTHTEGWHTAGLQRTANPYPELQNAVVSHKLHGQMHRPRAFRHCERKP